MKTNILVICFICLTSFLKTDFCVALELEKKGKPKPNVIIIYTDDHRYSGVHALGGQAVKTPNLDNLAHEGIAFTKTYLMGSMSEATCCPSRAMLHTGRNVFQLQGRGYTIPIEHITMGEAFQKAGYYTFHVGKWHNEAAALAREFDGGDKVCAFKYYLTDQFRMPYTDWEPNGDYKMENYYLLEYDDRGTLKKRPLTKEDKRGPTATEKYGPHVSEVLADASIKFITEYDKKEPFFHYLAIPCPHDPRQAPQKYHDMYPADEIKLPPSHMPMHPFDNGHQVLRDEQLAPWPRTEDVAKKHLSEYYAIITHLDEQIGRIVKALKESGQYENTIIVMAGDSGLAVGNHGLIGKQNIYDEDGLHIPFIVSDGLIKEADKGRRIDALAYVHDIYPTLCDLTKIEKPTSVTGKSLAPVINGKKETVRDYTYHPYRGNMRAYRKGHFKLIEYVRAPVNHEWNPKKFPTVTRGSRTTQLFNISEDPWEATNLAFLPQYEEVLTEMRTEMKQKAKALNDKPGMESTKTDFWEYYTD